MHHLSILLASSLFLASAASASISEADSKAASARAPDAPGGAFGEGSIWIWSAENLPNRWTAFRKTFTISGTPTSAITRIAADTKYWLYVNGNLVTFEGGLKRGPNPNDTYFDEKDIAGNLKNGKNTIAVLAWHFGKNGFSHNDSGAAGLLFQSDIVVGSTTTRISSDNSWKAITHPAYGEDQSGGQPYGTLAESNIYYDARKAAVMKDWFMPCYSDLNWPAAVPLALAGSAPWNALVKRPIPFFKTSALQSYTNSPPRYGTDATPIVMNLPSNLQVTPYLQVIGPAGAVIGIQTDHYTDGGESNVRSTYITSSGIQEFESLGWMSGTAVHYTIPSNVRIVALKYRESGYDTSMVGSFAGSDAFLGALWKKAARGIYVNMRDGFSDCPTRERAQWWGDVVNQQKGGFYAFDTNFHALGNKAISELVSWQRAGGELYSPVPSGSWNAELPAQMLASVHSFWMYYLYTGDASVVGTIYEKVKSYMSLWGLDGDGLIGHRTGDWDWGDWGGNIDSRVLDNAWYYMALDTTIRLAVAAGATSDLWYWQYLSNSISDRFNAVLWDEANRAYRSPGYEGDTDERGNALAIIAGLADSSKNDALANVLRFHGNSSPYMELYALEALYLLGNGADAESRMKGRYADQVNDPGYTLWEFWNRSDGTDNHGWSSGPLYVLSAYAAGVRPTSPGYDSYRVRPQMGTQEVINTVVPTRKGNIVVNLSRSGSTTFSMGLTSPSGTTATVGVPRLGMVNPTIKANGTIVYRDEAYVAGPTGLLPAGRDFDYVYFSVQPGAWTIEETGTEPTPCSEEGGTCEVSGTMLVRYGTNGSYVYKVVADAAIVCNNDTFGRDPYYGVAKQCHYSPAIDIGGPVGYTLCAAENGTCSFTGKANVMFGAYGAFANGTFEGGASCDEGLFGNPIPGIEKKCYYAQAPEGGDWTECAIETGLCSFAGARVVAYGSEGEYFYRTATDRISCNNHTFGGDPIYGSAKKCYYR